MLEAGKSRSISGLSQRPPADVNPPQARSPHEVLAVFAGGSCFPLIVDRRVGRFSHSWNAGCGGAQSPAFAPQRKEPSRRFVGDRGSAPVKLFRSICRPPGFVPWGSAPATLCLSVPPRRDPAVPASQSHGNGGKPHRAGSGFPNARLAQRNHLRPFPDQPTVRRGARAGTAHSAAELPACMDTALNPIATAYVHRAPHCRSCRPSPP